MNRNVLRAAFFPVLALAVLLFPCRIAPQQPATLPETKAPAPAQAAPASAPAPAAHYDAKLDWPWLGRFQEADLALGPPAPGDDRVVFMGDSITQGWNIEGPTGSFPGKPYINRGISGQTTPQMLLRFRQDVVGLQPKVVVILAGTNDIAGNTGPMTLEETEEQPGLHGRFGHGQPHSRGALLADPRLRLSLEAGIGSGAQNRHLNAWIKAYAAEKDYVYVDFHSAMKDAARRPSAHLEPGRRASESGRLRHHGPAGEGRH